MARTSLLLVTDPAYPARGRRYGEEDIWLATRLRTAFDLALCSPLDAEALMDRFDVVLVRNSGPVMDYKAAYDAFRDKARRTGATVINPVHGRGDMAGKGYLVELTAAGEPVIPTVDDIAHLDALPAAERYLVKPREGADSAGLRILDRAELAGAGADTGKQLIQPHLDLVEEVSLVFVGRSFSYAVRTISPDQRWDLEQFAPSAADLAFAQRFIDWNTLDIGVQRVDGCRTTEGDLLLIELEDLNPYLSLDVLDAPTRDAFVAALIRTIAAAPPRGPRALA